MTSLGTTEFRALFDAERDRLLRFLRHLCGNASDAEDLLQETFLTVWTKREQFQGRGSPAGWLRKTAFHVFANAHQRTRRRENLARRVEVEPLHTPFEHVDECEEQGVLVQRVRAAVDQLPEGPREAFILFRFEGHTCAEVADITGVSPKTVESRLARAVQLLSSRLKSRSPEARKA